MKYLLLGISEAIQTMVFWTVDDGNASLELLFWGLFENG